MNGKRSWRTLIVLLLLLCLPAKGEEIRPRIVSLSPSLTDIIFAINAGHLLVGVTEQCHVPAKAPELPRLKGYPAPDVDAILALGPTVVLDVMHHAPDYSRLEVMGIRYERFDQQSLAGLLEAYTRLGDLCNMRYRAGKLRDELQAALTMPIWLDKEKAPSLLFVVSREYGTGAIAKVTAVGRDGLYDQLITAVGCKNAYEGELPYPVMSGELIALLDPDIIVEGINLEVAAGLADLDLRQDWYALPHLEAGRKNRIFAVRTDYVFIPGYRLVLLKRDLESLVLRTGIAPALGW